MYSSVYALIERLAAESGYEEIQTQAWPGHQPGDTLTLDSVLDHAKASMKGHEAEGAGSYTILGRSFGCVVALQYVQKCRPSNLSKLILWGPPPYWLLWQMFRRDFEINRKVTEDKGTLIGEEFFYGLIPVESMLPRIETPTVIATGEDDPYVPAAFLEYLRSLLPEGHPAAFKPPVPGARHEVSENSAPDLIGAYRDALFA